MNNLKFIKQHRFGNRKIEFMSRYGNIRKGTTTDGSSVPKQGIFAVSLIISYLAYSNILPASFILTLPLLTFLVILPESNGLFFTAAARHDNKYQKAKRVEGKSSIAAKMRTDWQFYKDMLTACQHEECSNYTRIVGSIRAAVYFIAVVIGGWATYRKYMKENGHQTPMFLL